MHNEIPAFLTLNIDGYTQLARPPKRRAGVAATNIKGVDQSTAAAATRRVETASGLRLNRAADRNDFPHDGHSDSRSDSPFGSPFDSRSDSRNQAISIPADADALTAGAATNGRVIADGDNATLLAIWQISWRAIEGSNDSADLGLQLLAAYREPNRRHHSVRHLIDCLNNWEEWVEEAERAHEVAIALWFHDAIYDTTRHDSEARSARWALDALSAGNVPFDTVRRIRDLVIATRANENAYNDDARLINDIDLAILGTDAARYDEYEAQLQQEHPQIADFIYRRKRLDALKGIQMRPRIFHTAPARKALEAQARENLSRTIARLQDRASNVYAGGRLIGV